MYKVGSRYLSKSDKFKDYKVDKKDKYRVDGVKRRKAK